MFELLLNIFLHEKIFVIVLINSQLNSIHIPGFNEKKKSNNVDERKLFKFYFYYQIGTIEKNLKNFIFFTESELHFS